MNIDWDKAPEGFPLWLEYLEPAMEGDKGRRKARGEWVRDSANRYETVRGTYWSKPEEGYYVVHCPPTWNGEGMPPVGTVCEFKKYGRGSEWAEVEIIAHFRNSAPVAAFIPTGDGLKTVDQAIAECFRPIRTPEQIAAEERKESITGMINACRNASALAYSVCESLYDAGYRKQVKP